MSRIRAVLGSGWAWAAFWALSRALLGYVWRTTSSYIVGDVHYYADQVSQPGSWSATLVEYPTPVAWAMNLLRLITQADPGAFVWGFAASMVLLDAAWTHLLWRHGGRRRELAVLGWICFVTALGPLAYFRFDMAPAVLAGAGALLVHRRPGLAGTLVACGAALKLWPALLVLPLLGRGRRRRASMIGFLVTGVSLAAASLVAGGWNRLVSPLTWQSDRGLQVESVAATPLMYARVFGSGWQVAMSRFNAYEITGPAVTTALRVADLGFLVGLGLIALLGWRTIRLGERSTRTVALVMLATILVMIVTNKTLSPQYLLWLGGPVCAVLAGPDDQAPARWPLLVAFGACLLACATQVVYPIRYGEIISSPPGAFGTSVLVLRNTGLLAATIIVVGLAWYHSRRPSPTTS